MGITPEACQLCDAPYYAALTCPGVVTCIDIQIYLLKQMKGYLSLRWRIKSDASWRRCIQINIYLLKQMRGYLSLR